MSEGASTSAGASFALFDTAIGACGIAWADRRVVGVWLPESSAAATRARLLRRFPDAVEREPDDEIRDVAESIASLLAGEPRDLSRVPLDLGRVDPFDRKVYELARAIPPGTTRTYGDLATALGDRTLAREVGQSLGRNPFPIVVPCHRVVAAGGRTGGFTAPGGVSTKLRMLEIEGAREPEAPTFWDV